MADDSKDRRYKLEAKAVIVRDKHSPNGRAQWVRTATAQNRDALFRRARVLTSNLLWALGDVERVLAGESRTGLTSPEGMTYRDLDVLVARLDSTLSTWLQENVTTHRVRFLRASTDGAGAWDDENPQAALQAFERSWLAQEHHASARPMPPDEAVDLGIAAYRRTRGSRGDKSKLDLLHEAFEALGLEISDEKEIKKLITRAARSE